jgi:hypothetical protein
MPGGGEENNKVLNLDSRVLGWDLNAGPSKYEAGMLSTGFGC